MDGELLEKTVSCQKKYQCDVVKFGMTIACDDNGNMTPHSNSINVYMPQEALNEYFCGNKTKIKVHVWSGLYKKELFRDIKFPDGKVHEDNYVTPMILNKAEKIVFIDYPGYFYYMRENSIMYSGFTKEKALTYNLYKELYSIIVPNCPEFNDLLVERWILRYLYTYREIVKLRNKECQELRKIIYKEVKDDKFFLLKQHLSNSCKRQLLIFCSLRYGLILVLILLNGDKSMQNNGRKYLMFPHGGSGNHGCEAIVRTTADLINSKDLVLFSNDIQEDKKYIQDLSFTIQSPQTHVKRFSYDYIKSAIQYYVFGKKDAFDVLSFKPVISACVQGSVLLSIGGDNYCYGDNDYLYLVDRCAQKNGCKTVLWGCSVGADNLTEKMRKDLASFDLIIARESISYSTLKQINPNTILAPDPAFTLRMAAGIIQKEAQNASMIGINISPMIQDNEKISNITIENYSYLIEKIITETKCNILLIPHVVKRGNDDRVLLKKLYDRTSDKTRVYLVEDQNCMQLKSIISKCECFVGARTHATIAAYSTCVPTLVIGYSVKAKGIAKDLFGTDDPFVLPVQHLTQKDNIYQAFFAIWNQRQDIRAHLEKMIPDYIEKVYDMKIALDHLS